MPTGEIKKIPEKCSIDWQKCVTLLAALLQVVAVIIGKREVDHLRVISSSNSEGNPFRPGEAIPLGSGHYCEKVIAEDRMLVIANALHDEEWKSGPGVRAGLISYLGIPIHYPDGSIFGVFCVLDNKQNEYGRLYIDLLQKFGHIIETDLRYQSLLEKSLERESLLEKIQRTSEENERLLTESARSRQAMLSIMEDMKRAEVALKKSEEKFRRLVENLIEEYFFYSHNTAGIFTYLSPSIKTVLGYSPGEFLTHYAEYLTDNPINEEVKRNTELCIKGERQPPYELEIYHKNRAVRMLEVSEIPVINEKGNVIAVEGIAHDITSRKKAEDALSFVARRGWSANGENFFEALAKYLAHSLHVDYAFIAKLVDEKNAETVALYAKGGIVKNIAYPLEGTPCEKVVGKKTCIYPENIQKLFPQDEMLVTMGVESYIGVPLWGAKGQAIGHVAAMDGKALTDIRDTEMILQVVAARVAGELERKAAEDILKESERELKEAQRIAHLGHWELGLLKDRLMWSDEVYRIFGLEKERPVASYEDFLALVHPEDRERVDRAYRYSVENKSEYDVIHRILLKDGAVRYVREQCKTEYDEEGKALRSLGTVLDITELKETELNLQKAKEQAEAASQAKSDFLSRMSHELRTPLNSILGFAQIMQEEREALKEKYLTCVDEILAAGWHLTDLVNDVLDISRVESGSLTVYPEAVNICPILEECLALVRPMADARGITVSSEITACINESLYADKTRLKKILLNLFSNAVKYNKDSGTLSVHCEKKEEGRFRISVTDTGIGLSEDNQKLVFSPFAKLKNVDPALQGAGLGISIANHLVQLMGGSMGVSSVPGKGSTFWVELKHADDMTHNEKQSGKGGR